MSEDLIIPALPDFIARASESVAEVKQLRQENTRRRAALRQYGRHDVLCGVYRTRNPGEACICGFDQALEGGE